MLEQIAGLGYIVNIVNIDPHQSNCVDLRELLKGDGMFLLDGTLTSTTFLLDGHLTLPKVIAIFIFQVHYFLENDNKSQKMKLTNRS